MLDLRPHPEGGWYRQTWVAEAEPGDRPAGTCIYFLLQRGERSHWHRVDAAEIWHYYAGAPLVLSASVSTDGPAVERILGPDLFNGQSPQSVVSPGWWQAARSFGDWTLAGCTVSPGFRFEGFELAAPGFDIKRSP
ncbi:cupin domain-containing protein [Rubellimicrobium rubrum]|uniref:Cupin domain-containing protein n=1 Tax=Rubellimicrobium rubrum TaxID=2585369 RepID=A0A5C4MY52_9RHOB|nr:cupin domain-containing protein [Rubellimicrobium rubrum]TNC50558.1 cupin domain-containing protein [Rubellimicrobium rubrum]